MIEELVIPNPEQVFAPVYDRLVQTDSRFVINMGGTGSGKSYSSAQKEVLVAIQRKVKTLVIRKVGATLKDSVIPSFKSRIEEFDLWEIFKENKTDRSLTCTQNDSTIIFRGLDDPEKLKSIEGIDRILVEEASELEREDFFELNRRVRGKPNIQITLNFNPIHEEHWLKKHFFDQQLDDCAIIHSTYQDNPFLTDKDREQIEWLKTFDYNQYRIYALGEWGITENNQPWLFAFKQAKHVKPTLPFFSSFPVHLTFDFNRDPVTCIAAQMSPQKGTRESFVHFIKEFAVTAQLSELCQQIRATFPNSLLFVTGDAAGNKGDVGFDHRHSTYYQMIKGYLRLNDKQMLLNSRNLEHNDSRLLCNALLTDYPNIFISQEGCPKLINDCLIAAVDENSTKPGMLKKDRTIYKMDLFDAFRYFFQTHFKGYVDKVYLKKVFNSK